MILTAVGCTGVFLPYMLFVCNLGANVTIAFGQLNVSIYMLSWHLCPSDLQQYMIAMVQVSAKPYNVPVFGSMDCSRDSFKQVNQFLRTAKADTVSTSKVDLIKLKSGTFSLSFKDHK